MAAHPPVRDIFRSFRRGGACPSRRFIGRLSFHVVGAGHRPARFLVSEQFRLTHPRPAPSAAAGRDWERSSPRRAKPVRRGAPSRRVLQASWSAKGGRVRRPAPTGFQADHSKTGGWAETPPRGETPNRSKKPTARGRPVFDRRNRDQRSMTPAASQAVRELSSQRDTCTSPMWDLPSSSMETRD